MSTDHYTRLAHDGKSLTIKEWSTLTGLTTSCIGTRIANGWDVQRALTTPSAGPRNGNGKRTKTEVERELNETPKEKLPHFLLKIINKEYDGTQFGQYLRRNHLKEFDRFFAVHCGGGSPA